MDIGPFYIDECCEKAGYNHDGVLVGKPQEDAPAPAEVEEVQEPIQEQPAEEVAEEAASAEPEIDLKSMAPSELRKMAEAKGVKGFKRMSKKKLIEALS